MKLFIVISFLRILSKAEEKKKKMERRQSRNSLMFQAHIMTFY